MLLGRGRMAHYLSRTHQLLPHQWCGGPSPSRRDEVAVDGTDAGKDPAVWAPDPLCSLSPLYSADADGPFLPPEWQGRQFSSAEDFQKVGTLHCPWSPECLHVGPLPSCSCIGVWVHEIVLTDGPVGGIDLETTDVYTEPTPLKCTAHGRHLHAFNYSDRGTTHPTSVSAGTSSQTTATTPDQAPEVDRSFILGRGRGQVEARTVRFEHSLSFHPAFKARDSEQGVSKTAPGGQ